MRAILICSVLAGILAAPVEAQTCKKAPPPFLPGLFPKSVGDLPLEFASVPGGGCMGMYRPTTDAARQSSPWVVVSLAVEPDEHVGESAEALRARYAHGSTPFLVVDGWPVTIAQRPIGDEFVVVKGSLRITVLVKNGDHGQASQELATPFLHLLLAEAPCG